SAGDCAFDHGDWTTLSLQGRAHCLHDSCLAITLPAVLAIALAPSHLNRASTTISSRRLTFLRSRCRRSGSLLQSTSHNCNMIVLAQSSKSRKTKVLLCVNTRRIKISVNYSLLRANPKANGRSAHCNSTVDIRGKQGDELINP